MLTRLAARLSDAVAAERAAFLRSLTDLRLQLEVDRAAAATAIADRDALEIRCAELFGV